MNSSSNDKHFARFDIDNYNFQIQTAVPKKGAKRFITYYWTVPELEIKCVIGSRLDGPEVLSGLKTIRRMAYKKLQDLAAARAHHPQPLNRRHPSLWVGDETIGIGKAAKLLKVSDDTVRRLITHKILKAKRTPGGKTRGGNYRIPLESILEYRANLDVVYNSGANEKSQESSPLAPLRARGAGAAAKELGVHRSTIWRRRRRGAVNPTA